MNGYKYLIENSYILKVKRLLSIYRHNQPAALHIYIIMYGQFEIVHKLKSWGPLLGIGSTIGEEVNF
jgi:hypothetical protein